MTKDTWELISYLATSLASLLAVIGIGFVAVQLYWQRKDSRFSFLDKLYSEFDTNESRRARESIYVASSEQLRLHNLSNEQNQDLHRKVESTLAMLDRTAYPILKGRVSADDAFELYAGVFLSLAFKLWPYVEDQREMRRKGGLRRRVSYRKFLEELVRKWAVQYAMVSGVKQPSSSRSTSEMLAALFSEVPGAIS